MENNATNDISNKRNRNKFTKIKFNYLFVIDSSRSIVTNVKFLRLQNSKLVSSLPTTHEYLTVTNT